MPPGMVPPMHPGFPSGGYDFNLRGPGPNPYWQPNRMMGPSHFSEPMWQARHDSPPQSKRKRRRSSVSSSGAANDAGYQSSISSMTSPGLPTDKKSAPSKAVSWVVDPGIRVILLFGIVGLIALYGKGTDCRPLLNLSKGCYCMRMNPMFYHSDCHFVFSRACRQTLHYNHVCKRAQLQPTVVRLYQMEQKQIHWKVNHLLRLIDLPRPPQRLPLPPVRPSPHQ